MKLSPAFLHLADGSKFTGFTPAGLAHECFGEVVFNTGLTGYVESLTDPSYAGQILTFTYPLIGNYGVPAKKFWESGRAQPRGVIMGELTTHPSHYQSERTLAEWLAAEKIPALVGVDTRALTKKIREHGVMLGAITSEARPHPTLSFAKERGRRQRPSTAVEGAGGGFTFRDPNKENLVATVSISKPKIYGNGKKRIIAVDCGMKENIIRCLTKLNATIVRVPYDYDYTAEPFDGIFLSNGPGDPKQCTATIAILKKALVFKKPIFGICLGSQILALAAGAKTYKLPFGHRGHNQPCQEVRSGHCVITSQNHGYAVDETTVPKDWFVNYRNLNDGSVEGLAHKTLPFFSVQFHPEASPGPTDTRELFEKFFKLL